MEYGILFITKLFENIKTFWKYYNTQNWNVKCNKMLFIVKRNNWYFKYFNVQIIALVGSIWHSYHQPTNCYLRLHLILFLLFKIIVKPKSKYQSPVLPCPIKQTPQKRDLDKGLTLNSLNQCNDYCFKSI